MARWVDKVASVDRLANAIKRNGRTSRLTPTEFMTSVGFRNWSKIKAHLESRELLEDVIRSGEYHYSEPEGVSRRQHMKRRQLG